MGEEDSPELGADNPNFIRILADAEKIYLDLQIVSAAIRINDAELFSGLDRENDGFVRLLLRESYHDFVLPGSDQIHHVVFEPRLLLHETGVIQLDLAISTRVPLNTRQALAMMWGPQKIFVKSEMSAPLIKGTLWAPLADFSIDVLDAGQPLGALEHQIPVSISDLLGVQMQAVLSVIKRSQDHWLIYPVAILDAEECCTPEDWKRVHRDDLIRLAIRGSYNRDVAPHVVVPKDLSMSGDHSLYAGLGSAVYVQWKGSAPWGLAELNTVLILEYALLLYERLRALEEASSRMSLGDRVLRTHYRSAVRVFSDLRQRELRSGEAREIVSHVLNDFGAYEIRNTIEVALNFSASAFATLSAERASRRAWWITVSATLVAILVAVAPIRDFLNSVPPPRSGENWLIGVFRWFEDQGFWGPWLAVGGVFFLVFGLWAFTRLSLWHPRGPRLLGRGFKWPTEFHVEQRDYSPAAGAQRTVLRAELSGRTGRDDSRIPSNGDSSINSESPQDSANT